MTLFPRNFFTFLILILSILFSSIASADFWSDVGDCFTDPCNCTRQPKSEDWKPDGDLDNISNITDGKYNYREDFKFDTWNGHHRDIPKTNENCPPYNKFGGRSNCLLQYAPPVVNSANYRIYCAEESPKNSFSKPYIRLRMQWCNFAACASFVEDLNASEGECKTLLTQYGIPPIRFCARIAYPQYSEKQEESGLKFDPGYHHHILDKNGFPRPDPGIKSSDDTVTYLPKVCLYEDPSANMSLTQFLEPYRINGSDFLDTDPFHQFSHAGSDKNIIVEKKYFFNHNDDAKNYYYDDDFSKEITPFVKPVSDPNAINDSFNEDYENWVKQFAYYKEEESLGCTYLSIGPFPPPYCSNLRKVEPSVSIHEICSQEAVLKDDGTYKIDYRKSTSILPCIMSKSVNNNFINNSVRLGIENFIPLCKSEQNPLEDNCINIYSQPNIEALHKIYKDHLPKCDSSNPTDNNTCIITDKSTGCTSGGNCRDEFRLIYGLKKSRESSATKYDGYPGDIESICQNTIEDTFPCISVIGVDNGPYNDLSINLSNISDSVKELNDNNQIEDNSSNGGLSAPSFTLKSQNDVNHTIQPYISYAGPDKEVVINNNVISPNSICVFSSGGDRENYNVGCVKRRGKPLISAESCINNTDSLCNSSSNYEPKSIVELSFANASEGTSAVPIDKIKGLVSSSNLTSGAYYNFLGVPIDAFVIDDEYIIPPFYGPRVPVTKNLTSLGSSSILGIYYDNKNIIDNSGKFNSSARYKTGIEYLNGEYFRGGRKLVISERESKMCHSLIEDPTDSNRLYDNTNCVLTKNYYADNINCEEFNAKGYFHTCTQDQIEQCPSKSTMDLTNYGTIYFRDCEKGIKCYQPPESVIYHLCKASVLPSDRIDPQNSGDNITLNNSQYYNYEDVESGYCAKRDSDKLTFNASKCGVRNKTAFESGVVVDIPDMPKCEGETSGFAYWSDAKVGEESVGKCFDGYALNDPENILQKRRCYQTSDRQSKLWENPKENYCVQAICLAQGPESPGSNGASFPSAKVGEYSIGVCPEGSYPILEKIQRECIKIESEDSDINEYMLKPLDKDIKLCQDGTEEINTKLGKIKFKYNKKDLQFKVTKAEDYWGEEIFDIEYGIQQNWQEHSENKPISPLIDFTPPYYNSASLTIEIEANNIENNYNYNYNYSQPLAVSDIYYLKSNIEIINNIIDHNQYFLWGIDTKHLRDTNEHTQVYFGNNLKFTFQYRPKSLTHWCSGPTCTRYTQGATGIKFKLRLKKQVNF